MMKKQSIKENSIFTIPLEDGRFALGQVSFVEPRALDSIICVFFGELLNQDGTVPMSLNPISVQFVTRDLLDCGEWEIIKELATIYYVEGAINLSGLRSADFVGAKVRGSGSIRTFLNAYWGLRPWNEMHNPKYYEEMLLSNSCMPPRSRLIYKE